MKKLNKAFLICFLSFLCIVGIFPSSADAKSLNTYTIHADKKKGKKTDKKTEKNYKPEEHTAVDKNGKHISLEEQNRNVDSSEKLFFIASLSGAKKIYGDGYTDKDWKEDEEAAYEKRIDNAGGYIMTSPIGGNKIRIEAPWSSKKKRRAKAKKTVSYNYIQTKLGKDLSNSYGYKNFDDMLTAIYGNTDTKKKMAIVFKDKKKQEEFCYFNPKRKVWMPRYKFLNEAMRIELDGELAKVEIPVDVSDSKSIAKGDDVYAGDEATPEANVVYDSDADDLETALTSLFISGGDGINTLIAKCNTSLERIIYGRIVFNGVNYFSFEMIKGNPYGILGSYIYKIFHSFAIPVLLLMALAQITKAGWVSRTAEQRNIFKDVLGKSILVILLLFFIPPIVDVLISFKDVMLQEVSKQMAPDLASLFNIDTSDENSIINIYRSNANDGKHIFDGLLYLSICFVTLFYFVTYISTAIAVMISFMFFPLLAIFSITDNKLLDSWMKELLGNVFVPVLDAVLLLIPVLLQTLITENPTLRNFIILIACYSVIPSRALIRRMLGVGGSIGSEMLGFGAMMGTARMLGGLKNKVVGGAGNLIGALGEANNHRKQANMYADLAHANGEDGQLDGSFSKLGKIRNGGKLGKLNSVNPDGAKENNGVDGDNGIKSENGDSVMDGEQLKTVNAERVSETDAITDGGLDDLGVGADEGVGELGTVASTNENGVGGMDDDGLHTQEQRAMDINNVLKQHANVDNFENPEFRNALNFAERAKLHKQKANRTAVHGIARAAGGTVGSVAGGVVGGAIMGGATMMAGPSVNVMAASAGVGVGSTLGGFTGRNVADGAATAGMYVGRKVNPTNFRASYTAPYTPSVTQARPVTLGNYTPAPPRPRTQYGGNTYNRNATNYSPNSTFTPNSNNTYTPNSTFTPDNMPTDISKYTENMRSWVSNFTQDNGFSTEQASFFEDDIKTLNAGQGEAYDELMNYYDVSQQDDNNYNRKGQQSRREAIAIINKMTREKGLNLDRKSYNDLVNSITAERNNWKKNSRRTK